jgi:hypothetical protein
MVDDGKTSVFKGIVLMLDGTGFLDAFLRGLVA